VSKVRNSLAVGFICFSFFFLIPPAYAEDGLTAEVYNVLGQNNAPVLPQGAEPIYITQVDNIDFNWGSGQVLNSSRSEDVIVKFSGNFTPNSTGTTYITAPADDGVRLYLDNTLYINDWYDKGGGGSTADVPTTQGVPMVIEMWYYENGGGANVRLMWFTDNGWEAIPASAFIEPVSVSPSPEPSSEPSPSPSPEPTPTATSDTQTATTPTVPPTVDTTTSTSDTSTSVNNTDTSTATSETTTAVVEPTQPSPTPSVPVEPAPVPPTPPAVEPEPPVEEPLPLAPEPESPPTPKPEPELEPEPPAVEPTPEPVQPEPPLEEPEPPMVQADEIDLESLEPDTPVELSNGVVVTAEVAIAVQLLQDPAALLQELFTDPGAALAALGSVGADMTPEVREESEKVIIAAVIAGNIATTASISAASAGAAYRRKP